MCTRSLACQGGECGYCRKAGHSPSNCPLLAKNNSFLADGRTSRVCRAFLVAMAKAGAYNAECSDTTCTRAHDQPCSLSSSLFPLSSVLCPLSSVCPLVPFSLFLPFSLSPSHTHIVASPLPYRAPHAHSPRIPVSSVHRYTVSGP